MPITEFATLELLPHPNPSIPNPFSVSPLRDHLRLIAEKQSAISGYPVFFFTSLRSDSNPSPHSAIFYLLSGWSSVPAHYDWIQGQTNQDLLKLTKDIIGVKGLAHIDVDFNEVMLQVGLGGAKAGQEKLGPQDGVLVISKGNGDGTSALEGLCLDGDETLKYHLEWLADGVSQTLDTTSGVEVMKLLDI